MSQIVAATSKQAGQPVLEEFLQAAALKAYVDYGLGELPVLPRKMTSVAALYALVVPFKKKFPELYKKETVEALIPAIAHGLFCRQVS